MFIKMAVDAFSREPQECSVELLTRVNQRFFVFYVIFIMAFSAIERRVFAREIESGQPVIEIPDPIGPPDQLAGSSEMFHVAGYTILMTRAGVQSLFGLDSTSENLMAIEAFLPADLVSGFVTFLAVLQALQR